MSAKEKMLVEIAAASNEDINAFIAWLQEQDHFAETDKLV